MRKLLIFLLLSLAAAADPLEVTSLHWTRVKAKDGDKLSGHVTLSAPAPEGGVTLVLEPAFKLEIPMTLKVPAGQTGADFPAKIFDERIFRRDNPEPTKVTIVLDGKEYEFAGPTVDESESP